MIESINIRLSSVCSSDKRMDIIDKNKLCDTPVNKYEISCEACKFPNIDKTPDPYYIAKKRNFSGIEIMEADLGNLFISDRIKQIFETLFPNQCDYKKTYIEDTSIPTKWWLAIPKNLIESGKVNENVLRCNTCNEPFSAHPGTQYTFRIDDFEAPFDIIKSNNWSSCDNKDWKLSWIGREIFLSVRLIFLLKKISAKGIYQNAFSKYKQLTRDEKNWIELSMTKIGDLKLNKQFDITETSINKFKQTYSVFNTDTTRLQQYEKKFKTGTNELTKIICNLNDGTELNIGFDAPFIVEKIDDWEQTKSGSKLITFAFDKFGNRLLFDPKDKSCPVYFYDHETMIYDLLFSSILNLTEK